MRRGPSSWRPWKWIPRYFWGWHSLGELLLKKGELADGLRCIYRARSIQAKEAASYLILSELFAEQGHLELAMGELHQLTALAPPQEVLGEAYAMLGEPTGTWPTRRPPPRTSPWPPRPTPRRADPWAALGDMARADSRWEDALRCYREALSRKPDAADLQVQMGYILLNTSQFQEGEQLFLTALEADPGEVQRLPGPVRVLPQSAAARGPAGHGEAGPGPGPGRPGRVERHGRGQEVRGLCVEATEAYEKALSLAPMHRKAANNLGFLLEKRMQAGEVELRNRAMEAWKRRLLICRDEGQSLKKATEHLTKLGIPEETIRQWLEHDPTPGS